MVGDALEETLSATELLLEGEGGIKGRRVGREVTLQGI